ncbi:MAG TPA: hypothetical protein VJJ55_01990 [Candidatus Paceibacterota bacterium]
MTKKRITIDELAGMIKCGFDATATKADIIRLDGDIVGLKKDVYILKQDIAALKVDIARLEKEIAELRQDILHVNRLPSVVVRRIDRMEDDIRLIKTKVGMR